MKKLRFPVLQTASTPLKKIESSHIGEPVAEALSKILKEIGLTLQGKNVLVIGYGWIGHSVAKSIKARQAKVHCYDINWLKFLDAHYNGFVNGNKVNMLSTADIIIGTTGTTSIVKEDFKHLESGCFLVSASSRRVEIDLGTLKSESSSITKITEYIDQYRLAQDNKVIFLVANGEPINFVIDSMPNEIMDLIITDLFCCLVSLCEKSYSNEIHPAPLEIEQEIAKTWFTVQNLVI
ncbi:MAG: NAD(P)-dependent oxidoreductase [Thermodesulfobacteriota bacterium]